MDFRTVLGEFSFAVNALELLRLVHTIRFRIRFLLKFKEVDKDKTNGIGRLYMQLRYLWLNSFVSKNQYSTIHEFTKIERLADKTAR